MSELVLGEITSENSLALTSDGIMEHLFWLSEDEQERAKNFTVVMDKARELGIAETVFNEYQEKAPLYKVPELWEIPKSFKTEVALNEFPLSCLPGTLAEYLKAVARFVQVYPEMAVLPLLSVLSLCVQDKAVVKHPGNNHTETLNLYTMTIAAPGERKTGSFKEFMRPVKEYEEHYNQINQYRVDEYNSTKNFLERQRNAFMTGAKASLEKVKELTRELSSLEPVHELKLNVSDATPEALAWEMYLQGGKIGVVDDEGSVFDVLSGLYSGGMVNINIFLKAYDGSDYTIIRKTKDDINLKNPLLTMGLMTQPSHFEETVSNKQFAGRGFIYRFLFSFPDSKAGFQNLRSENVPDNLQRQYNDLIKRLLALPKLDKLPVIRTDKESYSVYEDYHNHLQLGMRPGGMFEHLKEWASKQFARCLKISAILHLCEHQPSEPISAKTALNAVGIAMWTENHALKALSFSMFDKVKRDAVYVLQRIKSANKLELSKKEILQLCQRFTADDIAEPLELLEDMNYIRCSTIKSGKRGRPAERCKINPLLFE